VNTALDQLLQRLLPGTTSEAARVSLRVAGREVSVTIAGLGRALVAVGHRDALELGEGRVVLSIDVPGAARIDLPTLLVASGRRTTMLRVAGEPLVLRRRVVRDQALAEALGSGRPADPVASTHVAA
jgi:hypothetical protein